MSHHHHRRGADLIETAAERDLLCSDAGLLSAAVALCKNGPCPSPPDRTPNGDKGAPPRASSSSSSPSSPACLLSPISNLMVEFERMSLQDGVDGPCGRERRRSGGHRSHREPRDCVAPSEVAFGVGRLSLEPSDQDAALERAGSEPPAGWRSGEDRCGSGSSDEYLTAEESLEAAGLRTSGGGAAAAGGRSLCARSKSWDHGGRDVSGSGSSGSYKIGRASCRERVSSPV